MYLFSLKRLINYIIITTIYYKFMLYVVDTMRPKFNEIKEKNE